MENQTTQKKLPKLSKQDKAFVEKVVETGNLTQAVQESFNISDPNYAGVKGHRLIRKDKIINAIQTIAERIPDDDLVKVHLEGLNAGKTIYKNNNSTGEIEEVGYEPDYAVRHKYLDSAYKLKGVYAPEKTEPVKENVYNFFFEPKFQQNIKNYDQNLKEQILNKDDTET